MAGGGQVRIYPPFGGIFNWGHLETVKSGRGAQKVRMDAFRQTASAVHFLNSLLYQLEFRASQFRPHPLPPPDKGTTLRFNSAVPATDLAPSTTLPPSVRFPPLREGNRKLARFPLRSRGNLTEGVLEKYRFYSRVVGERCTLISLPPLPRRGRGRTRYAARARDSPLPRRGRGAGGEGKQQQARP